MNDGLLIFNSLIDDLMRRHLITTFALVFLLCACWGGRRLIILLVVLKVATVGPILQNLQVGFDFFVLLRKLRAARNVILKALVNSPVFFEGFDMPDPALVRIS